MIRYVATATITFHVEADDQSEALELAALGRCRPRTRTCDPLPASAHRSDRRLSLPHLLDRPGEAMIRFRCERDVLIALLEKTDEQHVALCATPMDTVEVIVAGDVVAAARVGTEHPGTRGPIDRVAVRDALQRLGDPRAQIAITDIGRVLVESAIGEFIPVEALRPSPAPEGPTE